MKSLQFNLLVWLFAASIAFAQSDPISVSNSTIEWKGYKLTSDHYGTIKLLGGDLAFEDDQLTGGSFSVDMTSIVVTDLTGGSKKNLEKHLKSGDFFDVEQFPEATMVITAVEKTDDGYSVTGDFTIKGQTHPVTFPMTVKDNSAIADVKIDRSKYNVRYGSNSFFDNLGNKAIYDEFDLSVTLNF
jgi:polyisoprenoid-binding protein YceI